MLSGLVAGLAMVATMQGSALGLAAQFERKNQALVELDEARLQAERLARTAQSLGESRNRIHLMVAMSQLQEVRNAYASALDALLARNATDRDTSLSRVLSEGPEPLAATLRNFSAVADAIGIDSDPREIRTIARTLRRTVEGPLPAAFERLREHHRRTSRRRWRWSAWRAEGSRLSPPSFS